MNEAETPHPRGVIVLRVQSDETSSSPRLHAAMIALVIARGKTTFKAIAITIPTKANDLKRKKNQEKKRNRNTTAHCLLAFDVNKSNSQNGGKIKDVLDLLSCVENRKSWLIRNHEFAPRVAVSYHWSRADHFHDQSQLRAQRLSSPALAPKRSRSSRMPRANRILDQNQSRAQRSSSPALGPKRSNHTPRANRIHDQIQSRARNLTNPVLTSESTETLGT